MNTHFVRPTAFNLAGPGITTTFVPTPYGTSTVKAAQPTRRPTKDDLEFVVFRAQLRARNRRLQQSLGHGLPSGVARRTTRVPADWYSSSSSRSSTPSTFSYASTPSATTATTTTDTDDAPESPVYYAQLPLPVLTGQSGGPFPEAPSPSLLPIPTQLFGRTYPPEAPSPSLLPIPTELFGRTTYPPEAPSPSLLPIPTFGSPAPTTTTTTRPRLLQSYGSARDVMGRGHSFITEGDPVLTPHHVFPPNLRRTPGAPVWADDANSYFRGPIGLGIMMDI
ncbi:hypothetical protein L226DRAFT_523089 [Lentinus tigrinus ALCF2SS1-7]|uniref:Uncharacterized protein n=1 Tax=Lentinus tigrinus ALCF2SS1-6 TaxID=1328759 RepID=A0A5C2S844_9APHY|nr:hypothetical protein L227DRAFT_105164 [Lentinus tigrinus ALCF2SS1-6]RPD74764.1 hypothetical protein L226DRAFT_523089 [Lentinus tigrinus ALCF2SS1-7]